MSSDAMVCAGLLSYTYSIGMLADDVVYADLL